MGEGLGGMSGVSASASARTPDVKHFFSNKIDVCVENYYQVKLYIILIIC